ncbi:hypothetical protein BX600DRAFT_150657 [Xylariales sp. PMI_506]|nr:hypothetical protein BX600DRAFT_150657 [Xylariales sp. PMI_506]
MLTEKTFLFVEKTVKGYAQSRTSPMFPLESSERPNTTSDTYVNSLAPNLCLARLQPSSSFFPVAIFFESKFHTLGCLSVVWKKNTGSQRPLRPIPQSMS